MSHLALIRHGQSEWNALELWTGWTDVLLTQKGKQEARDAGEKIKEIHWDVAYVSALKRSVETLDEIKSVLGITTIATITSPALNERDYGNFDGMNKFEVEDKYGSDLFEKWHRGWDYPLPHGETLKDVYNRAVPFFQSQILPQLEAGKNVIVSAHGNSLRAIVKYLENISDEEIPMLEIPTGQVYLYQFDQTGKIVDKIVK